jgi:hypothetical protein
MAPPPITAPPHAQAQSFARAILTDIIFIPVLVDKVPKMIRSPQGIPIRATPLSAQKKRGTATRLTVIRAP